MNVKEAYKELDRIDNVLLDIRKDLECLEDSIEEELCKRENAELEEVLDVVKAMEEVVEDSRAVLYQSRVGRRIYRER